jgi:hypothetical protein
VPGPRAPDRPHRDQGEIRLRRRSPAGWRDCALYGTRTYLCESRRFKTAEDAEKALATLVAEVEHCLGADWSKDASRSSSVYAVLHSAKDPAAMTLGTDAADNDHIVRLTLFVRTR